MSGAAGGGEAEVTGLFSTSHRHAGQVSTRCGGWGGSGGVGARDDGRMSMSFCDPRYGARGGREGRGRGAVDQRGGQWNRYQQVQCLLSTNCFWVMRSNGLGLSKPLPCPDMARSERLLLDTRSGRGAWRGDDGGTRESGSPADLGTHRVY